MQYIYSTQWFYQKSKEIEKDWNLGLAEGMVK